MNNLLTQNQIADMLDISKAAVCKKKGIDDFLEIMDNPNGKGRPVKK